MTIKADHEERIEFYHKLSKQRPLEEHELDRLEWLVKRVKALKRERAYKNRNRESIKEKQRAYLKTKKGKAKSARNFKAAYSRDPEKFRRKGKLWRENNPEKYAVHVAEKQQKREQEKLAKASGLTNV